MISFQSRRERKARIKGVYCALIIEHLQKNRYRNINCDNSNSGAVYSKRMLFVQSIQADQN